MLDIQYPTLPLESLSWLFLHLHDVDEGHTVSTMTHQSMKYKATPFVYKGVELSYNRVRSKVRLFTAKISAT